jgi:hypothetical protein
MIPVRAALVVALALVTAACAPPQEAQRLDVAPAATAPAQLYRPGPPQPLPAMRANAELVHDILELGFYMESGREIPQFSRFEGPVRVIARNVPNAQADADLDRLLARLRAEAQIDIARAAPGTDPGGNVITVDFVPRRVMQQAVPAAACFVVPNVGGWDDFVANRRSPVIDWTQVVVRTRVAFFVPSDTTGQEIRDCLHEELAQALGPLNDLYRLPDSVFNDDNFQTTLTGFDMLVLRAWYAPDLRPGMIRDEVAVRLPAVMNRLNPAGRRFAGALPGPTPRDWIAAVEQALAGTQGQGQRRAGAERAQAIAREAGWRDPRLALSLMLTARLAPREAGEAALSALLQAAEIYRRLPGGEVHAAHIDLQLAVQALASGQYPVVLDLTDRALPLARRTENAAFEATLSFLRAEALAQLGRVPEAERLIRETRAAAIYGFGSETAVEARIDEVARISGAALRLAARR